MASSAAQFHDPFRSARLFYRAVRGPDDDAIFAAINDDRAGYMNSNASNNRLPTPADATDFRKSVSEDLLGAIICLPCDDDATKAGIAIGEIHLKGLPPRLIHHRNTEVGVDILPEWQGKGYGSEAILWSLDFAFRRVGLHKVRIRAFEWNIGAVRLYERLGFTFEGRDREALWHEGRFWDSIEMGMVDREWWAMQKKDGN
jgi:RimJ/RimL family protein N-acetyltransferase